MKRFERALELSEDNGRTSDTGKLADPLVDPLAEPVAGEASALTKNSNTRHANGNNTSVVPVSPQQLDQARLRVATASTEGDAFRMARTQLLQKMRANGWKSLAMVSANPGDGVTCVALNLAMAIAQDSHYNALLVDLNLRQPGLHHLLGLHLTRGVESYFEGLESLENLLLRVHLPSFSLLPCLASVPHSSELLSSPLGQALVRELNERYDDRLVLYDLPPLLASDDALTILPSVDAALVVVSEGQTRTRQLVELRRLIGDCPIAGVILNRARAPEGSG